MSKYTIKGCQNCGLCFALAPEHFGLSDGYPYIKEQPTEEVLKKISCEHIVEVKDENILQ